VALANEIEMKITSATPLGVTHDDIHHGQAVACPIAGAFEASQEISNIGLHEILCGLFHLSPHVFELRVNHRAEPDRSRRAPARA
jgi:hypothetical protein